MQTYQQIYEKWNKGNLHKWTHYLPIYEELLSKYTSYSDLRILEIGVQRGGGSMMHKERFQNSTVIGIDIDERCRSVKGPDKIIIGDQADEKCLKLARNEGPYDIIIDDGGHTPDQQITSFWGLWQSLSFGGIYICEDIFTNAISGYTESRYGLSFLDLAKGLADKLGWWVMDKNCFKILGQDPDSYPYRFKNFATEEISSVKFYNGLVAIEKSKIKAPTHCVK